MLTYWRQLRLCKCWQQIITNFPRKFATIYIYPIYNLSLSERIEGNFPLTNHVNVCYKISWNMTSNCRQLIKMSIFMNISVTGHATFLGILVTTCSQQLQTKVDVNLITVNWRQLSNQVGKFSRTVIGNLPDFNFFFTKIFQIEFYKNKYFFNHVYSDVNFSLNTDKSWTFNCYFLNLRLFRF